MAETLAGAHPGARPGGPLAPSSEPLAIHATLPASSPDPPGGPLAPSSEPLAIHATLPASSPGVPGGSVGKGFPVHNWERYEFIRLLGRGGMGAVYMARDRRLGRIVALKFLRTEDPGMVQRFQQEARAQARIDHPLICKVFEVGEVEGKAYIAMHNFPAESRRR